MLSNNKVNLSLLVKKIISGGQTGADRAALDFAIAHNIPHGGWLPKGRKTEDGILDHKYQLEEMPTAEYSQRTEKNILEADGTLIISHGKLSDGSALTKELARKQGKPWLHVDMAGMTSAEAGNQVRHWIQKHRLGILNVAGARESKDPAIYQATMEVLSEVFLGHKEGR